MFTIFISFVLFKENRFSSVLKCFQFGPLLVHLKFKKNAILKIGGEILICWQPTNNIFEKIVKDGPRPNLGKVLGIWKKLNLYQVDLNQHG